MDTKNVMILFIVLVTLDNMWQHLPAGLDLSHIYYNITLGPVTPATYRNQFTIKEEFKQKEGSTATLVV